MVQSLRSRALRVIALLFSLFAVLLSPALARAATTIPGGNIINQTWTPAGSPYIIQGDITVPLTATLTIQPGTEVQFASSDGLATGLDTSRVEFTVKGTLNAVGTAASPISLKAQSGNGTSIWHGLIFDLATSASTNFVSVQNAVYGITHVGRLGEVGDLRQAQLATQHRRGLPRDRRHRIAQQVPVGRVDPHRAVVLGRDVLGRPHVVEVAVRHEDGERPQILLRDDLADAVHRIHAGVDDRAAGAWSAGDEVAVRLQRTGRKRREKHVGQGTRGRGAHSTSASP